MYNFSGPGSLMKARIAVSSRTTLQDLEVLLRDPDQAVRLSLLENEKSREWADALALHEMANPEKGNNVYLIVALCPFLSPSTYRIAAEEGSVRVWFALVNQARCPDDLLECFAMDERPEYRWVRTVALLRVNSCAQAA